MRLAQRADVVADPGRPLVLRGVAGGLHLALEPLDVRPVWPAMNVAEVLDDHAVLLGRHPADAGRRALADVAEQARPADLRLRLKTPAEQDRIGNTRSSRSTVSRIAQAWE